MEGYQPEKKMRIKEEVNKTQDAISEIEIKSHLISYARDFVKKEMLRMGYNEQIYQNIYSENQVLDGLVNFAAKMIIDCINEKWIKDFCESSAKFMMYFLSKENTEKDEIIKNLKAECDIYKDLYMKEITPINKNIKEITTDNKSGEPDVITNYVNNVIKKEIAAEKESEKRKLKEPTPQPKYKFIIEISENDDLEFIEKLNKLKDFWLHQQK